MTYVYVWWPLYPQSIGQCLVYRSSLLNRNKSILLQPLPLEAVRPKLASAKNFCTDVSVSHITLILNWDNIFVEIVAWFAGIWICYIWSCIYAIKGFYTLQISQLCFIVAIDCIGLLLFILKEYFFLRLLKYGSEWNAKTWS